MEVGKMVVTLRVESEIKEFQVMGTTSKGSFSMVDNQTGEQVYLTRNAWAMVLMHPEVNLHYQQVEHNDGHHVTLFLQ